MREMRSGFLAATDGLADYWDSRRKLELYDQFFAERIGWKWDAVLGELSTLGWTPPGERFVDWGCGSGVASRKALTAFEIYKTAIWDRSPAARDFARERILDEHPKVSVSTWDSREPAGGLWLISHVINELTDGAWEGLLSTISGHADAVIWIESGTREASRRLIAARERLRTAFQCVAPCPHQAACGLLTPENERHWCHHFTRPPGYVFQDSAWSAFSRELKIDLGTVPYSFLVLDRRPVKESPKERVIGHPRVFKGHAKLLTCTAGGVTEKTVQKRDDPDLFRRLRKR